MEDILIICGPTATGKTKFGIELAKKFNGEIVSADSRQVYTGKNLVYGKDLPKSVMYKVSSIKWNDKFLKYYEVDEVRVWLYDIVEEKEEYNVSFWRQCSQIVIEDILSRQKLPIIVGGSGLYIKSLVHHLPDVVVPPNPTLRKELEDKSVEYLTNYLSNLNSNIYLNESDRKNPRRLIRAIEKALSKSPQSTSPYHQYDFLQIGLTAPKEALFKKIEQRIKERIEAGAGKEDPQLASHPDKWLNLERQIARRQLTWFKKQADIRWFDITTSNWESQALETVENWYNTHI